MLQAHIIFNDINFFSDPSCLILSFDSFYHWKGRKKRWRLFYVLILAKNIINCSKKKVVYKINFGEKSDITFVFQVKQKLLLRGAYKM